MKNKFITIFFVLIFSLHFCKFSTAEEFNFNITELQITENGNIVEGVNGGVATSKNNQIKIIADNFKYNKLTTLLVAEGNVKLVDKIKDLIIESNKIFYLKNEEKIYTEGKTYINIKDKYNFDGKDLILLRNEMILSSNQEATIRDNNLNTYELDQFQYIIEEEIIKGKKIIITQNKKNKSEKIFFQEGFFNLKEAFSS